MTFLLWSTIFCIGLHEAFAAVHTMQLGYTEPLKLRLQREGKLPEYLRRKNEFLSSKANNLASANQPLVDFDDMAYFGFITLGTPQQRFVAFIDTGSSDTWMPDVTCSAGQQTCGLYCDIVPYESCITFCPSKCCKQSRGIDLDKIFANKDDGCGAKSKFNSSASSTYTAGSGTFDLSYQTGEVKGFWGQDTFCIVNSSFCVTNQAFGQAQSITGGFVVQPIDGILGLAWPSLAFNGNKPPVFNGVDQGVLDQPLFTVFMTQNGATVTNGGAITYGAIDGVNCESAISYTPITSTTFWQFKLLGVAAGDYSRQGSWDAISDTAATFIGGPTAIVQALAQAVGATYNQQGNSYEIDCDAQIPDIVFTIGGKAFSITPVNFVMALGPGPCQFAFFAQDGGGFYPAWMLGPPFIREFCQIYDIGNQRLGLAAHKSTLRNE